MIGDLSRKRKIFISIVVFLVFLVFSGALINSVDEEAGPGQGNGKGGSIGSTDFKIGLAYVAGISIVSFVLMVKTDFDNRLRIALLSLTFFVFFILEGGHLITLFSKLLGSEGVRASAGEVGWRHIQRHSVTLAIAGLILTLGLTFILGRALCGYGCPVGVFQELLHSIRSRVKKMPGLIIPTKWSYWIRWIIIGITGILILFFGFDLIQIVAPYQLWQLEIAMPGIFVMTAFFATSIFFYRPFCRLLCPFGAFASLAARFSLWGLSREDECKSCELCRMECNVDDCQKYGECYLCGRCVRACGEEALTVS